MSKPAIVRLRLDVKEAAGEKTNLDVMTAVPVTGVVAAAACDTLLQEMKASPGSGEWTVRLPAALLEPREGETP